MGQEREILCPGQKKIDENCSQKVIVTTMRHFQDPGVQFVPLAAHCRVLQGLFWCENHQLGHY